MITAPCAKDPLMWASQQPNATCVLNGSAATVGVVTTPFVLLDARFRMCTLAPMSRKLARSLQSTMGHSRTLFRSHGSGADNGVGHAQRKLALMLVLVLRRQIVLLVMALFRCCRWKVST